MFLYQFCDFAINVTQGRKEQIRRLSELVHMFKVALRGFPMTKDIQLGQGERSK